MSQKEKYLSNIELSAFCQQISMVLKAGLPTYYGISILCDEAPDEATKELLLSIYKPMESGSTLHAALKETHRFSDYMLNMIKLGEETGRLEEVLNSLSAYYEREETLRTSIKSAVTYPFVLTFLMLVVIVVMISKVVPVFSQVYNELGSELSGFSLVLMNISTAINKYIIVFVALFILIIIFGIILLKTNLGSYLFQGSTLSLSIASSRFANCMFLALSSGLDTDKGLNLAEELVNNTYMREKINKCKEHIAHGESFSNALLKSSIFSKMYSSWIAIGSRTGSMDEVMERISSAYEDETDALLSRYISILEPALIVILCLFIGLILISFLLPLLGIMSSIG